MTLGVSQGDTRAPPGVILGLGFKRAGMAQTKRLRLQSASTRRRVVGTHGWPILLALHFPTAATGTPFDSRYGCLTGRMGWLCLNNILNHYSTIVEEVPHKLLDCQAPLV
jgi:hypothetical protein